MASKAELETAIRNDILNDIRALIESKYGTDALQISASEIAIPVLDKEGNEKWAVAKVSIPRGTRSGGSYEPYDGYAAAEDYRLEMEDKAAKVAAREEKKRLAEAEKGRKREMRTRKVKETDLKKMASQIAVKDNE
jgi:hypothetical protein